MKVKDVMERKVLAIKPHTTLKEAAKVLVENNINGVPVVDDENRIVGLLTMGDIIHHIRSRMEALGIVLAPGPFDVVDLYFLEPNFLENKDAIKEVANDPVSEVMKKRFHHVHEDDELEDAISLLSKKDISVLPVVDSKMHVLGIVTRGDILRVIAGEK